MAIKRNVTIVDLYSLPRGLTNMGEGFISEYCLNRDSFISWEDFQDFVSENGNTEEVSTLQLFEVAEKIERENTYIHCE